jgi:hypothetical protein
MNKIDDLFKNKLEEHTLEPSGDAWIKLNANLSKKNKGFAWYSALAAILLMGILITSIIWLNKREATQFVSEQTKRLPVEPSGENKLIADSVSKPLLTETISITKAKKKSKSVSPITGDPPSLPVMIKEIEDEPLVAEILPMEVIAETTIKKQPIVIEYRLESILPQKKETPLEAEVVEKKNGLQKALEFAREAKNSDSPLGEIRQAKDDLFALTFKKDKQKKQ